jgi:excisionase family DNA binding protein
MSVESMTTMDVDYRDVVTIQMAMQICGVSRRTIYNWIERKKIHAYYTPGGEVRILRVSLRLRPRRSD